MLAIEQKKRFDIFMVDNEIKRINLQSKDIFQGIWNSLQTAQIFPAKTAAFKNLNNDLLY